MPQSFIAEVVLTHPNAPLAATLEAVPHATITEESIRPAPTADEPAVFYRVTDVAFHAFETELARDHTVAEWTQTMDFGDTRMYRVQLGPATIFVSPTLYELGIHVVNSESADLGWRFWLETGDRNHLSALWDYCREKDIQFELEVLRNSGAQPMNEQVRIKAALTDRQQQIAQVATRMGYYEKGGASAKDVAAELDIAPSTLSTHLRRINATVFDSLFAAELD
ncbi:helix-turn-helix domain-containing protein [Natrinema versiforme]|uniref:LuxR family transcriptional regulator n=1 Tax=Natrinema versiforme TaxID=88724 RepID=A0A4P8WLP4_9EURY|nr:helix-turn-helix domain-containing protein [Natrinema versiforme]QCS44489.1 LuxR family transcriptional regulator [Natrinema versiforme]